MRGAFWFDGRDEGETVGLWKNSVLEGCRRGSHDPEMREKKASEIQQ